MSLFQPISYLRSPSTFSICESLSQLYNLTKSDYCRGSGLLSRLVNYHPERLSALVFISLGYINPGNTIDMGSRQFTFNDTLELISFGF